MECMSPNTPVGMQKGELADLMEANGVTNANQLAKKLGVHRSTALRWIKGERRIDRGTALLIKSVLKKKPK
jgi:plasmid maintenance system antidote protein VapI